MTEVEVLGDEGWRYDTLTVYADDACLVFDLVEDDMPNSIRITDKEKVKDIARVLVEFLKQEE